VLTRTGVVAVSPREALVVTRMSQDPSNSCVGVSVGRDDLPQCCAGSAQCVVLGVSVDARRDRGIGMAEPLGDYSHRHAPEVQRRAARVAGIVQPIGRTPAAVVSRCHMFVSAPGVYGCPASLHAM